MTDLVPSKIEPLAAEEEQLLRSQLTDVREEVRDNPYVLEAVKVLAVKGYRSAIGSYWNAVVDDLRRKVMHRSLDLFNKELAGSRTVSTYEDFQNHVTDYDLIEGAYRIGVVGWEAKKLLHQARETRHIFDGHPASSEPSLVKVLNMIADCNRYVLSQDYPSVIVDIDTYMDTLASADYNQNAVAAEQAVSDLPGVYQTELVNRLYAAYQDPASSTTLRSHIEFFAPILWSVLPKSDREQIGKRLDKDFAGGNKQQIDPGVDFIVLVGGLRYVSAATRRAVYEPVIEELEQGLDQWSTESSAVRALERLGTTVPPELIPRYVQALTLTFVGYKGFSTLYARTDFYSDGASPVVKRLFTQFDDASVQAFIDTLQSNDKLVRRLEGPGQLKRARILGNILLDRPKLQAEAQEFLELLVDEDETGKFLTQLIKAVKEKEKTE